MVVTYKTRCQGN